MQQNSSPQPIALSSVLELHAKIITTVAFRPHSHPAPQWSDARGSARSLLIEVFRADGRDISESMLALSAVDFEEKKRKQKYKKVKGDAPPPEEVPYLPRPATRKELWSMTYNAIPSNDVTGIAIMMYSIAPFAHVDKLDRHEVWIYDEVAMVVKQDDWVASIRGINLGVENTRQTFAQTLESIAMHPDQDLIRTLWLQEGVIRSAIILLLSPVDDIHDAVISLIQHSFDDVDDRGDCFRVLLHNHPNATMDGLSEFLQTFIQAARITPDSCGLAKWLVRCFTDVLDALCRPTESSEAFLQSQAFLSAYSDDRPMSRRIIDLWHGMTTSLAVIFKRTPIWATLYASEIMVDWMRDALIFGRQMTEHIRAFEAAALGQSSTHASFDENFQESPIKTTSVGKKMVQELEAVLEDLVSWLRLTE